MNDRVMKSIKEASHRIARKPIDAAASMKTTRTKSAQIEKTKDVLLSEYRVMVGEHERMLRLALNEAEALAWQTEYPHLVFPILAMEKAEAVSAWRKKQESCQQSRFDLAFAV